MATEELVTRSFMPFLLAIYEEDANFTHIPDRTLSCSATAKVIALYGRLCRGTDASDRALRDMIEHYIEGFRKQLVHEHPGCAPIDRLAMKRLLWDDPSSKHLICVARCITENRVSRLFLF